MGTIQIIRQNVIANTKFASTVTPWGIFNSRTGSGSAGTVSRLTSVGRSSNTSLQAVTTFGWLRHNAMLPYAGTDRLQAQCYISASASTSAAARIGINYYSSAGVYLGSQPDTAYVSVTNTSWVLLGNDMGSVGANATQMQPYIELVPFAGTVTFRVTDMWFEYYNGAARPFFDGDSADAYLSYSTLSKGWFGTPNDSSSFAEFGVVGTGVTGSVLDGPDVLGF